MAEESLDDYPSAKKGSIKGFASKVFKETSVTAVSAILLTGSIPRKIFRALIFLTFTAGFLYQCVKFLTYVLEYPTVLSIDIVRPDVYMMPAYTFCNCNKDFLYENVSGPSPLAMLDERYYVSGCYSINSRIDSTLDPKMKFSFDHWLPIYDFYSFNPEENETFNPGAQSGIVFAIDSPFNPVNPFEKGIFLKPGFLYKITIRMHEEKLLPYPYKTNCLNYTDIWLKNNRSGPRSQKACRDLCTVKLFQFCLNCNYPDNGYPSDVRTCNRDDFLRNDTLCKDEDFFDNDLMDKCRRNCREDCWRLIKVEIDFDETEIVAMHYKPQFQEVEAFSYIGGFIGIWLGVSLVQVADILESMFRIGHFVVKRSLLSCFKNLRTTNNDAS